MVQFFLVPAIVDFYANSNQSSQLNSRKCKLEFLVVFSILFLSYVLFFSYMYLNEQLIEETYTSVLCDFSSTLHYVFLKDDMLEHKQTSLVVHEAFALRDAWRKPLGYVGIPTETYGCRSLRVSVRRISDLTSSKNRKKTHYSRLQRFLCVIMNLKLTAT